MKVVLLVSSVASLLVLAASAYDENFRGDWREAQAQYKALLVNTAGSDMAKRAASAFPIEHKQLYLAELGTIDRCTTCHLGVENPAAVSAQQPLTRHPGERLAQHPVDKFGCTICHQGQGRATTQVAAHGWHEDGSAVEHVDSPMLRGSAIYTSCGRCHYEIDLYGGEADLFASGSDGHAGTGGGRRPLGVTDEMLRRTLPGAEALAEAKRLVVQSGCLGCHKYRGRGGVLGPELTYVGDKTKHDFDFGHVKGEHTVEQWLFEHFKLPQEVSPDTVMPDLGLSDEDARKLALYMMSLHRKSAPASHVPPPQRADLSQGTIRGETLYDMFCSSCHGADGFGTTMRAGLWPTDADPWGRDWDATSVMTEKRGDMDVIVPSLNHADTLATVSDEYLREIIINGRPGTKMLGWLEEGGLTQDEITLLVDYIRRWEPRLPDLAEVDSARGESRIGQALYRANCAACHGYDGEGGIGLRLNSPTFLAVASDPFLRDAIVHGRPNTAMPSWREFDARELSDLLAYLRQWQPQRSDISGVLARSDGPESLEVSASIGRTLYKANCVMCHGADGSGDLAPTLNTQAFLTVVSDAFLAETLIEGRPGTGMPSWRHLSSEDVASILRFLRTWQTGPAKTDEWHAQDVPLGDLDAGRYLFAGHCASCHGNHAEGAVGPQLNNSVFLRGASNVMLREWITHGKEGTEMRGFRKGGQGITELSERQIEDLVAYLRSLERLSDDEIVRVSKSPHGRPEKGAAIYAVNCVGCHGDRGEGASGPALSNSHFLRYASDGFLMATMALGRSGTEMRPVKRGPQSILELSSDEVNDLVAYLRSWEHEPPHAPDANSSMPGTAVATGIPHRFVVPWDLARGRELYVSNCAGCHGSDGKGSWAPELNNPGFLSAATDGFLQATIVRGRTGTAMRPFGRGTHGMTDLHSDDVDDIVAYMRSAWGDATTAPSPMTIPAERSLRHKRQTDAGDIGKSNPQEAKATRRGADSSTSADTKDTQPSVIAAIPHAQGE